MKYVFYTQEENCCIPCCVQSILYRRGFSVPEQYEIAKKLNKTDKGVFIYRDLSPLREFFDSYSLSVGFFNPFNEVVESDLFLQEELERESDVMVGFDYTQLYRDCEACSTHFALVDSFNPGDRNGEIVLHDNQRARLERVRYSNLIKSMQKREECGFYFIR